MLLMRCCACVRMWGLHDQAGDSVLWLVTLSSYEANQQDQKALESPAMLGGCWKDQGTEPSFYGGQGLTNWLALPSVLLWFLGLRA